MSPILLITLQNKRSVCLTENFLAFSELFSVAVSRFVYMKNTSAFLFKFRISLNSGMMELSHVLGNLTNNFNSPRN